MNLDDTFQAKRVEMIRKVEDAAVQTWTAREWGNEAAFLDKVLPLVEGGIMATVRLTDAYFTMRGRLHGQGGVRTDAPVDPADFTIEKLRGMDPREVYSRPFGALGQKLADGAAFIDADEAAGEYVRRLVSTDMQLALTYSAKTWMVQNGDSGSVGGD